MTFRGVLFYFDSFAARLCAPFSHQEKGFMGIRGFVKINQLAIFFLLG